MPGRILVVEDDPGITRSLRRLLAHEEYYVHAVGSGEQALVHLDEDRDYDLILLDVALPGVDGFSTCREVRQRGITLPILVLTGRTSPAEKVTGLTAGADDYITKPFHPDELIARIQAHLRRSHDYNDSNGSVGNIAVDDYLTLDRQNRDALVNGRRASLTAREYELLELFVRNADTPLRKRWLFQQLWGCASDSSSKILAVTIRRLRLKIEPDPTKPYYIRSLRGYGYKLVAGSRGDDAVTVS